MSLLIRTLKDTQNDSHSTAVLSCQHIFASFSDFRNCFRLFLYYAESTDKEILQYGHIVAALAESAGSVGYDGMKTQYTGLRLNMRCWPQETRAQEAGDGILHIVTNSLIQYKRVSIV